MRAPGIILICIAAALISGAAYASANPFYLDGGYFNETEALEAGTVLRELYKDPASEKNLVISDGFGGTLVIEEGKVYQFSCDNRSVRGLVPLSGICGSLICDQTDTRIQRQACSWEVRRREVRCEDMCGCVCGASVVP